MAAVLIKEVGKDWAEIEIKAVTLEPVIKALGCRRMDSITLSFENSNFCIIFDEEGQLRKAQPNVGIKSKNGVIPMLGAIMVTRSDEEMSNWTPVEPGDLEQVKAWKLWSDLED